MSNGKITPADEAGVLNGYVATLAIQQRFQLRPNPRFKGGDTPKYEIFARIGTAETQIGSAWEKTIERGDHAGDKMLQLTLDDPSFDEPLYVSAFPNGDGTFDVAWRRQRRIDPSRIRADAARADDEIPY